MGQWLTRTRSSSGRDSPDSSPRPSWPARAARWCSLDQEPRANLGGQAFWSFGGLFFVDSPEQRRMGIKDSLELAWQDWLGSAGFDRARGPLAAACGRGPTSTSRPARSGPGCTGRACAGSRSSAGPNAAAASPTGTATPCRASTSPGAPDPAWWSRSSAGARRPSVTACVDLRASGTGSTSWSSTDGAVDRRPRRGARSRATESRGAPSTRDVVGDFELTRARRRSSPPAGSAATTTSCGALAGAPRLRRRTT